MNMCPRKMKPFFKNSQVSVEAVGSTFSDSLPFLFMMVDALRFGFEL